MPGLHRTTVPRSVPMLDAMPHRECDCPRCGSANTRSLPIVFEHRTGRYRRTPGRRQLSDAATALCVLGVACILGGSLGAYVAVTFVVLAAAVHGASERAREDMQACWSAMFRCRRCGWTFLVENRSCTAPADGLASTSAWPGSRYAQNCALTPAANERLATSCTPLTYW